MTKYKIECEVEVPDDVSEDDVYEWARFELKENGSLDVSNPLCHTELEALSLTVDLRRLTKKQGGEG